MMALPKSAALFLAVALLPAAGEYREAIDAAARSLAFDNKNPDTFGPALMLYARACEQAQDWHRARDVYLEVSRLFRGTDHGDLASQRLGFIMKERAASELLSAVSQVAGARSYISPAIADQLLASTRTTATPLPAAGPLARLSNRERHVLVLLGQGASRSEIAQTLGVSVKTVESHCANIKGKLGARNARDLARMAVSLTSGGSI